MNRVSGRINEAALVDVPLKFLSTTWTHHGYRMTQQPTGVWMFQTFNEGPSEKWLEDAFEDASLCVQH